MVVFGQRYTICEDKNSWYSILHTPFKTLITSILALLLALQPLLLIALPP
jgi:hypothetical protein